MINDENEDKEAKRTVIDNICSETLDCRLLSIVVVNIRRKCQTFVIQ